jgi:C-terminal processing protease CtpA/Prc
MRFKFFTKTLIVLFISIFFINCSSESEATPENLEVHDFVWKGLNAYYLWQSDKPNLADTRFSNQGQLNSFLQEFSSPENLFENLLNRPTDRFSWIVDDYIALENSFQGITLNSGMEFGLVRYEDTPTNLFAYVRYVIPNSDAAAKGIARGMLFNGVDGTPLTETNYNSLLFGENTSYSINFADYNDGNPISNGTSIEVTKSQLQENPIAVSKVITEGSQKIGYLMYNQFSSAFDAELNAAFANFKSETVNDLIIDLRYNGGGSVRTATYLGGMVTGQFNNELFSKQVWNEKVQAALDESNFINNFTNQINHDNINEAINSLGLTRVYFIITGSSASASELVINSLSAYIDVKLIGTKTVGKQVGSITLYDSDNLTRNGDNLNQNHQYAMQPIVLEIKNKDDQNYPNGIVPGVTLPGIELAENYGNLGVLGERSDPLLDRTLLYISTGARFSNQSKIDASKTIEIFNSKLATPSRNEMYVEFKK